MNVRWAQIAALGIGAAAVGAFAFLWAGGFFDAWDGQVIGREPGDGDWVQVRIEAPAGIQVRSWPAAVVDALRLADAPATRKERFTFAFTVDGVEGEPSTTSPGAVSLGVLAAVLAVAGRNMVVAGAPWAFTPASAPAPRGPARGPSKVTRPARSRGQRRRR